MSITQFIAGHILTADDLNNNFADKVSQSETTDQSIASNLTVAGLLKAKTPTAGDNSTNVATTAFVANSITASGNYNASAVAITGGTIGNTTITSGKRTGGTIDGAVIGGATPAAGTFTTLSATSGSFGSLAVSEIDAIIGANTPQSGTFTTLSATGAIANHNLMINGQNANASMEFGSTTSASAPFIDFHSSGNNVDYDARVLASGGTTSLGNGTITITAALTNTSGNFVAHGGIDNTVIGAVTPAAGTFTTLTLSADPTTALQAATKQYADKMLPLAGGTMTGALTSTKTGTALTLAGNISIGGNNISSSGANFTVGGSGTAGVWQANTIAGGGSNVPAGGRTITRTAGSATTSNFTVVTNCNINGIATDRPWPNTFIVSSDTMDTSGAGGGEGGIMALVHNYGGSAMVGARNSLDVRGELTATSGNTNSSSYTTGYFGFKSSVNDGGTGTGLGQTQGSGFALNPRVELFNGATNWTGLIGGEVDLAVYTGASVRSLALWSLVLLQGHAVKGANGTDTGLAIGSQAGTVVGLDRAIGIGGTGGSFVLDPATGVIVGVSNQDHYGALNVAHQLTMPKALGGFDLQKMNFTEATSGFLIRGPNFSVGPAGGIASANAVIAPTTTGVQFDIPSQIVTGVAISVSGTGNHNNRNSYWPQDIIYGPAMGQYRVDTTKVIDAGIVAAGSGGTNGTQTVTGTTGTGTKFQANVTVSGGAITAINSITVAGSYTANPDDVTAEPVTGGGLVGAKLSLGMGVASITILVPDVAANGSTTYPNPVATTGGSGAGCTLTLTWGANNTLSLNPSGGDVQINSTLLLLSALNQHVNVIATGNYTATSNDNIIIIKKATGSVTQVTLPSSPSTGRIITVKDGKGDCSVNNITIVPDSGTIDGSANVVLNVNYASVDLVYNGSEWGVI